jgi:anti-sigma-K factor RskA
MQPFFRALIRSADLRMEAPFWRTVSAVLGVLALALLVAALIGRPPPDFSTRRVIAIVRDGARHPLWAIRLAPTADQIAADNLHPLPVPPGRVYQLWLSVRGVAGLQPLGLLPQSGQKIIPVTPGNARRLRGTGRLVVTLEAAGGSQQPGPTGPVLFRGRLDDGSCASLNAAGNSKYL